MHVTSQTVSNEPLPAVVMKLSLGNQNYIAVFPKLSCLRVFSEDEYCNFSKQE